MSLLTPHHLHSFSLPEGPLRIVSLVPSQTELLAHLQLDEQVVGITKFCVHPHHWWQQKTRIGGTKTVDVAKVFSLQPHLVIANKEENVKEQVLDLAAALPVYLADVNNLEDALQMIGDIGTLTQRTIKARQLIGEIASSFDGMVPLNPVRKAAYLIWKEPWMTVGSDTFIHTMMQQAGFENVFAHRLRYPVVELEEIVEKAPDLLLLSSEPYPFGQKHIELLQPILPHTEILLVDGEMFSWYGSRLLHAPAYITGLMRQISR